ncbi:MAG: ATP-dependent Clp protease proteolytic subunit [Actinobacteria bacterium]|nr:ATP-dependent Clp protease proteolytic subunit [Actinomycetota bacterium]
MPDKKVVIRFFAPVLNETINALLHEIDERMKQGVRDFTILVSSPGGSVHFGLSAYNYLKGIPAEIVTHNFGSVDSIGLVLFCGGDVRYSVPQASFLLHGVSSGFRNENLDEKDLDERLDSMRIDSENIARIIAANSVLEVDEVEKAMFERTTLDAEQAREWGIIHDIKADLFAEGDEVVTIEYPLSPEPQQ